MAGNKNSGRRSLAQINGERQRNSVYSVSKRALEGSASDLVAARLSKAMRAIDLAFSHGKIAERLTAADLILSRLMPRLKHVEISSDPDNPVQLLSHVELLHAIISVASEAKKQINPDNRADSPTLKILPPTSSNTSLTKLEQ